MDVFEIVWPGASASEIEDLMVQHFKSTLRPKEGDNVKVDVTCRDGVCTLRFRSPVRGASGPDSFSFARGFTFSRNELPDGIDLRVPPVPPDAVAGVWIILRGDAPDSSELSETAAKIRARLTRIADVKAVELFGAHPAETHIYFDPEKLALCGFTPSQCVDAICKHLDSIAEDPPKQDAALHEQFEDIAIGMRRDIPQRTPTRLRDLAAVRADGLPGSAARFDGRPCVAIGVHLGGDMVSETLEHVREELVEIRRSLPEGVSLVRFIPDADAAEAAKGGLLAEVHLPTVARKPVPIERFFDELNRQLDKRGATKDALLLWTRRSNVLRIVMRPTPGGPEIDDLRRSLLSASLPATRLRLTHLPEHHGIWAPEFGLSVALMGPDEEQLAKWSSQLLTRLSEAGCSDLVLETGAARPKLLLAPKRERLAELDLTAGDIARAVEMAGDGLVVPAKNKAASVVRLLFGQGAKDLGALAISVPDGLTGPGKLIPVSELAELRVSLAPAVRHLHNGRRAVMLTVRPPADAARPGEFVADKARQLARELGLSGEYAVEVE
ncbi:MAG: efflux RND transporter permease subunit [Pirellulaceae bacterium]